jgi:hypothetical protein
MTAPSRRRRLAPDEAVPACRDALTVRTRSDMPAQWATTQVNIARALGSMANADPNRPRALLLDAEAALVAALGIYTPEHMALSHDKAAEALGRVRAKAHRSGRLRPHRPDL